MSFKRFSTTVKQKAVSPFEGDIIRAGDEGPGPVVGDEAISIAKTRELESVGQRVYGYGKRHQHVSEVVVGHEVVDEVEPGREPANEEIFELEVVAKESVCGIATIADQERATKEAISANVRAVVDLKGEDDSEQNFPSATEGDVEEGASTAEEVGEEASF
ncbi:hypothetical protein ACLOJK_029265 [Asimina triloba]